MIAWQSLRDQARSAGVSRLRRGQRAARPRERVDLPLALLAAFWLGVLALLGWGGALWVEHSGWRDPPVLRPLPDDRILGNLRSHHAPIVDAVALDDGAGDVLIGREDGTIHRHDRRTGLTGEERMPGEDDGLTTPLAALSAGCGWMGTSEGTCALPAHAFALTRGGGLAMRDPGGRWSVLLPDAAWIGRDGTPIEQAQVQAWAASDDGRWILALAGSQGAGLFDQARRRWVLPTGEGPLAGDAAAGSLHLLAAGGRFYVGTPEGLGVLEPGSAPEFGWSDGFAVLDLERTAEGGVLALIEGPCASGGTGCLTLERVESLARRTVLIGERARDSLLSGGTVAHAAMQRGQLVTVGGAGVHAYDPARRGWTALASGAVDSVHAVDGGETVVAAIGGRVLRIAAGQIAAEWTVAEPPFRQVEQFEDGRILVLDALGRLREVTRGTLLTHRDPGVPDGAVFTSGDRVGDTVLLAGPDGVLVHDVGRRRFSWQAAALQSPLSMAAGGRLVAAGGRFWSVAASTGSVSLISLDGEHPDVVVKPAEVRRMAPPLRAVHGTEDALWIVDANGEPFQARPTGPQSAIFRSILGAPRHGSGRFTSAAALSTQMAFADKGRIWTYNLAQRSWDGPLDGPPGETISDIALGEGFIALTASGRVMRHAGQAWEDVLRAGPPAALSLEQVTDARRDGSLLFFAGAGLVQRYDTVASRWDGLWRGGTGSARILDIAGGVPIWLSGGRLRRGEQPMTAVDIEGAWLAPDGYVAQARAPSGAPFAMHFPGPYAAPACTHLSAGPPGEAVVDATALPDGRLVVLTEAALWMYVDQERRWLSLTGLQRRGGSLRLHVSGGHLVALGTTALWTVRLADIPKPDSCAAPEAQLPFRQVVAGAAALEMSASGDAVAILQADGRAQIWRDGQIEPRLPATGEAPPSQELRSVVETAGGLLFAARDALWRYDTGTRQWRRHAVTLADGPARIVELDIAARAGSGLVTVTAWTADGRSHGGQWSPDGAAVILSRLAPVRAPAIATDPRTIEALSERAGIWAVASAAGMELGNAAAERLTSRIEYGAAAPVLDRPHQLAGHTVWISGSAEAPRTLHILPAPGRVAELRGDLAGLTYAYAPGGDRAWGLQENTGTLWRVDGLGGVHACTIAAGLAAPRSCREAVPPPMRLDPAALQVSFSLGQHVLLGIDGAPILIDNGFRNPARLAGPRIVDRTVMFRHAGQLYLWEAPGADLWAVEPETAGATRVAEAVEQVIARDEDLALVSGGVLHVQSGAAPAARPRLEDGTVLAAASIDWRRSGAILGLDAEGRPVRLDDGAVLGIALPDPQSIVTILPGPGVLWVQRRDGTIDAMRETVCELLRGYGPIYRPCWRSLNAEPLRLSGGAPLRAAVADGSMVLHFDHTALLVRPLAGSTEPAPAAPRGWRLPQMLTDFVDTIRAMIDPATGELSPPELRAAGAGASDLLDGARRPLATIANTARPWGDMDAGWVRWDGAQRRFAFDTAGGQAQLVAPAEALRGGVFLPAHPGWAVAAPAGGFHWINRHGVWRHTRSGSDPVAVRIDPLPAPEGLARGAVLLPGRQTLDPGAGVETPDTDRYSVRLGDLSIVEMLRAGSLSGTLTRTDGTSSDAFAANGFRHDQRTGIGWVGETAVLLYPGGMAPISGLSGFDAGPGPDGTPPSRVVSVGGDVFALVSGGWFRSVGAGGWQPAADPFARRALFRAAGMAWTLDRGRLEIEPQSPGDRWRAQRSGLAFHVDGLVALAGTDRHVVAATGLGTHQLQSARQLGQPGPAVDATVPADRFDALDIAPGDPVLFATAPVGVRSWDPALPGWVMPDPRRRPWESRRPLDGGGFELALSASAAPQIRRRVDLVGGGSRAARFGWAAGEHMPFDRATAIHASADALFIGTRFGLRRVALDGAMRDGLLDVSVRAGDAPAAEIAAVGSPQADPGRHLARAGDGGCAEMTAAGARRCSGAADLSRRHVAATWLWEWIKTDGAVAGEYLPRGAAPVPIDPDPRTRWPHDRLRSALVCEGTFLELADSGQILLEGTPVSGSLLRLPVVGRSLHCNGEDRALGRGERLASGAYVLGQSQTLRRTGGWVSVGEAQAEALRLRAAGAVALDGERLRMVATARDQSIRYRLDDDEWRVMPWSGGLPALDKTNAVLSAGADLDRVTPVGVLRASLAAGLRLDADAMLPATLPDPGGLSACSPDRAERLDGRTHTVPSAPGAPIRLRCNDGMVVAGDSRKSAGIGALRRLDEDPFARREMVGGDLPWRWTRIDDQPGGMPSADISYRGEPLTLSAGRFDIDDLRSVAAPFDGSVEFLAASGLWRNPSGRLGLFDAVRPGEFANPAGVEAIASDRAADGTTPLLCRRHGGRHVAAGADGAGLVLADCAEWRGSDALWQYRVPHGGEPRATGTSLNGIEIGREISGGRFNDLVAAGPAVAPAAGGRALAFPNAFGAGLIERRGGPIGHIAIPDGMAALTMVGEDPARYLLTRGGARSLDGDGEPGCAALGGFLHSLPETARVIRAEVRSPSVLRLFLDGPREIPRLVRIDCTGAGAAEAGVLRFEVRERTRHFARMRHLPGSTAWLELRADAPSVTVSDGRDRIASLPELSDDVLTLVGLDSGREALLVTSSDVYLLDADAAISRLGAPSAVPSRPRAPGLVAPLVRSEQAEKKVAERAGSVPPPPAAAPVPSPRSAAPVGGDTAAAAAPSERGGRQRGADPGQLTVMEMLGRAAVPTVDPAALDTEQRRTIQRALRSLGYYREGIDGIFGPRTLAAIRAFQSARGDAATGRLTTDQHEALKAQDGARR